MKKKKMLFIILGLLLIYPAYSVYELQQAFSEGNDLEQVYELVISYQISIWISWVVMAAVAVHYKWLGKKRNFFFYFTYVFLLLAFSIFGFYMQHIVNSYEIPSRFRDNYSLGVYAALQNFGVAAVFTFFLQIMVRWFSSKWHRR